ncbi:MAG: hypothetical protein H7Y09_15480 [Chitinophagaceae bacterium]|nr:hypothetical protein [Anaerolineae bacterium]
MELASTYSFDSNQQSVWKPLIDQELIAKALSEVKETTLLENKKIDWRAVAKFSNGLISPRTGSRALLDLIHNAEPKQSRRYWNSEANISGKLALWVSALSNRLSAR